MNGVSGLGCLTARGLPIRIDFHSLGSTNSCRKSISTPSTTPCPSRRLIRQSASYLALSSSSAIAQLAGSRMSSAGSPRTMHMVWFKTPLTPRALARKFCRRSNGRGQGGLARPARGRVGCACAARHPKPQLRASRLIQIPLKPDERIPNHGNPAQGRRCFVR